MKVGIGLFLPLFRQNFYTFPFFSAGDRPLMSMIKPLKMAHCKKYTKYKGAHNKVRSPDDAWSGQSASPGCFASTEIQASWPASHHLADSGCFVRILIQKIRSPVKTRTCSVKVLYMQQWGIRNGSHIVDGLTLFQIQKYVLKFRMLCLRWFTTPCFGSET